MKKDLSSRVLFCVCVAVVAGMLHVPAAYPQSYRNEEVSFENDHGHVKLAGTLSVPTGTGAFPAVLLIAAAGPEGRDEEVEGHRVFVVLADYLLRRGIAVLRYDKRGVGASTGNFDSASFDDLVSDAAAAFHYLKTRPEVAARRAGIIGHSEGGSIGPAVAAADADVAFVVAMAGSGLSGECVYRSSPWSARSIARCRPAPMLRSWSLCCGPFPDRRCRCCPA